MGDESYSLSFAFCVALGPKKKSFFLFFSRQWKQTKNPSSHVVGQQQNSKNPQFHSKKLERSRRRATLLVHDHDGLRCDYRSLLRRPRGHESRTDQKSMRVVLSKNKDAILALMQVFDVYREQFKRSSAWRWVRRRALLRSRESDQSSKQSERCARLEACPPRIVLASRSPRGWTLPRKTLQ